SYEIRLLRGSEGASCTLRADIAQGTQDRLRCPRALPAQDTGDDVGWIAAGLAAWVGIEYNMFKWALGVEGLSHAMDAVAHAPPLSQEQALTADESIAMSLSETSADLGIAAHAYMVSPQAMTAWQEEKAKWRNGILDGQIATTQDDTLVRFVEIMRKK